MSYLSITLLVSFLLFYQADAISDKAMREKVKIFEKCRKLDGNLSEKKAKPFFNLESVKDLTDHKCYVTCVLQEYDVLTDDNKFDEIKSKAFRKKIWPNPEELSSLSKISNACVKEVKKDKDVCKYVYNQADCFFKKVNKKRDNGDF